MCAVGVQGTVESVRRNAERLNPRAKVVVTDSVVTVDKPELVRGKKVLVVEDGPTLTHGGMSYGAGRFFFLKSVVFRA